MDGAATHCLTARPLRVAAPRRHPPKRQRSTVEGFLEASATAFFVLGLPVVAAAIALAAARTGSGHLVVELVMPFVAGRRLGDAPFYVY